MKLIPYGRRHSGLQALPWMVFLLLFAAPVMAVESFTYKASYKGVLSLFNRLDIGDVIFEVASLDSPGQGGAVNHLRLSVSSANYPTVEKLYSYRYRYDSFFDSARRQTRFFENVKTTKKTKHHLAYLDFNKDEVQLYRVDRSEPVLTKAFVQQLLNRGGLADAETKLQPAANALMAIPQNTLDRLSLLQDMRFDNFSIGASRDYDITNGDELMRYRYRVEKKEQLDFNGKSTAVWKVRIDAFEAGATGFQMAQAADSNAFLDGMQTRNQLLHAPVYVWISADERRVPLKFVSHQALGQFVVALQPARVAE
ncbi:MAG: DUF3108 domain-containing protein [Chromatiales bacterium]|jgi:hypothetical protein